MKRVKLSELPTIDTTAGMYTIATDKDNRSCKIPLDSLRSSWANMSEHERAEFIRAVTEAVPSETEPETITEEQIRALIDGAGNDNNNQ